MKKIYNKEWFNESDLEYIEKTRTVKDWVLYDLNT